MESFTIQAIYEKGVLKPKKKLNLPEHSVVELRVSSARTAKQKNSIRVPAWSLGTFTRKRSRHYGKGTSPHAEALSIKSKKACKDSKINGAYDDDLHGRHSQPALGIP